MKTQYLLPLLILSALVATPLATAAEPALETNFFNGKDLDGWKGSDGFWTVEDGVIVGHSDNNIAKNEFLWSGIEVADFYLSLDVKLTPNNRNAGIQFRSKSVDARGQAQGYQADIGKNVWGRLYHEHDRGKLDWTDRGEKAVKPGEWNRYEILVSGDRIWTAINGTLSVALKDPEGERKGLIALQLHSGPPQTVRYRIRKLIHDPEVALAGMTEAELNAAANTLESKPEEQPAPNPEETISNPARAQGSLDFDDPWDPRASAVGPVKLIDSLLGGRAVSLDGKSARLEFAPNGPWQVSDRPFSLSIWVKPASLRQAGILCSGGYGWRHGWLLDMHPNGSVRVETSNSKNSSNGTVHTKGGMLRPEQWAHLAVTIAADRTTRIFINGIEKASGKIGGADLTNPAARLVVGGIENATNHNFHGEIDRVQVFSKALTGDEVAKLFAPGKNLASKIPLAPSVRRFGGDDARAETVAPFADGRFVLEKDDVVVFMGQTDMVRSRLDGTLETALAAHFADQKPRFRNMAWEGDTVYEQWRDIDFGAWEDQLGAAGATVVIAQFGQMEALDGEGRIDEFVAAYKKLLDQVASRTRRVVLVSPRPFEKPDSPYMPDHRSKNGALEKYGKAISELAKRRRALFVDLLNGPSRLTTNGIHLTEEGQPRVARLIATALGANPEPMPELQAAVTEKNRLWFDNWRPMNWSFAFGDRTTQPFSKAGGNRPPLKVELEAFKPLLARAEERVHQLALGNTFDATPAETTQPASPPPGDHSPEAELASFRVRDGFEVNLFASEADGVVKPVQMRWDDHGRLWVICTPTYPHIEPGLRPGDYILVCEDTDGGVADKFERFAEGLFIPMGLEFGDGGVYVTEATELVHLMDTDGDGKADQRRVLLSGFGTADSHQMVNGLERGPLGDLWFTQGHHAYSRVETPFGISNLKKSGVWRYRPKTGRLDGFFNQSKAGLNCQGVTHDDWGQTFHNSAAISGGFYTSAGAVATDRTSVLPPMTSDPSRNTGIEFIGTRHLPEDMHGDIIWGGYMSNTVQVRELIDDGAGFRAEKLPDLIQSDRREFRPVNVKIGPDGAIYVCDWYNATIGHYQASYRDPSRDRTHGRIWRVTAKGRPLVKPPELDGLNVAQLLELLRSPERLTRHNAKKRLFDLPTSAVIPEVKDWLGRLDDGDSEYAHLVYEASGILAAHEEVWPELVEQMIGMNDPRVRAIGARLIGRWSDRLANPLELLARTAADPSPRVRQETIVACSYVPSANAIRIAAGALDQQRDRFINYAFGLTVHAVRPHWLPALESGELTFDANPSHLRAILEADGSGETLSLVRKLAEDGEPGSLALLVQLGQPEDLTFALQKGSERPIVLRALLEAARVHGRKPSGDLAAALAVILEKEDPATAPLAVSLAGAWEVRSLAGVVKAQLTAAGTSEPIRQAAVEAILLLDNSPDTRALVAKYASSDQSEATRTSAIRSLATKDPARAAALTVELAKTISDPQEIAPLVAALIQGPARGTKLAGLIGQNPPGKETLTRLHHALGLTGQTCPRLQAAIDAAQGITSNSPATYDEQYVKKLKSLVLSAGDSQRGALAYKKAGTCVACHKIDGTGGDIGPDLTEVGSGRSLELLIESVLWPNRQIREGYMTTKITTKDDQLHVGYRLSEEGGVVRLREIATPNVKKIARENIKNEEEAGSSMVAGLTAGLTDAELADLIAYLSALKKK